MKKFELQNMIKGWFIGNIEPSVLKTGEVEVAVKRYNKGDYEGKHYHKIATEITVIVEGVVRMGGIEYKTGDIILVKPGESIDFFCHTDCITTVVKIPGAMNDKYI